MNQRERKLSEAMAGGKEFNLTDEDVAILNKECPQWRDALKRGDPKLIFILHAGHEDYEPTKKALEAIEPKMPVEFHMIVLSKHKKED